MNNLKNTTSLVYANCGGNSAVSAFSISPVPSNSVLSIAPNTPNASLGISENTPFNVTIFDKSGVIFYSDSSNDGKTDPAFSSVIKIAKAMDVELIDLFQADQVFKDINSFDKSQLVLPGSIICYTKRNEQDETWLFDKYVFSHCIMQSKD